MATNNSPFPNVSRRRERLLLLIAAAMFCSWIGWLAYLALTTTRPIVLSRPQFLAAQVDVIARLQGGAEHPESQVEVGEVTWARAEPLRPRQGQTITVMNLPAIGPRDGWSGPGEYILPLIKEGDDYRLAPIAPSPGYGPSGGPPRIYHLTPDTRAQLEHIRHPH